MKCSKCYREAIVVSEDNKRSLCPQHFDEDIGFFTLKRDKIHCCHCKKEITDDYIFFDKYQNMFCSFNCILKYNHLKFVEKES